MASSNVTRGGSRACIITKYAYQAQSICHSEFWLNVVLKENTVATEPRRW